MEVLILILKQTQLMEDLLQSLVEVGVKGGTIVEAKGMATVLTNLEDIPLLSVFSEMIEDVENYTENPKVLFFVIESEKRDEITNHIKSIIGDLKSPNSGIMFTLPINYLDGYKKEKL